MKSTIQPTNIETIESGASLSDRDKQSPSALSMPMLFSSGESSLTTQDSRELTAPCSETKANTKAVSLSDRLTESLISAGLVRGIIPSSMRKRSGQRILDFAAYELAGESADEQKAVC